MCWFDSTWKLVAVLFQRSGCKNCLFWLYRCCFSLCVPSYHVTYRPSHIFVHASLDSNAILAITKMTLSLAFMYANGYQPWNGNEMFFVWLFNIIYNKYQVSISKILEILTLTNSIHSNNFQFWQYLKWLYNTLLCMPMAINLEMDMNFFLIIQYHL